MARGRYLSLEEARHLNRLDQFAKEHPSTGDERAFDALFHRMVSAAEPEKPSAKRRTSDADPSED